MLLKIISLFFSLYPKMVVLSENDLVNEGERNSSILFSSDSLLGVYFPDLMPMACIDYSFHDSQLACAQHFCRVKVKEWEEQIL